MSESSCSSCSGSAPVSTCEGVSSTPALHEPYVLILEHSPKVALGVLGVVLQRHSIPIRTVRLYSNDSFPNLSDESVRKQILAIASLGGPQGSYEEHQYPYLKTEKEFMREVVSWRVPLLGICLGAQLMADAFGGRTVPAPQFEVGYLPLSVNHASARSDPVLSTLFSTDSKSDSESFTSPVRPVLMHHGDTFTPPPSATLFLRSHPNGYSAAFRLPSSCSLAVQFHPEASIEDLTLWTSFAGWKYESVGTSVEKVLEEADRLKGQAKETSESFFEAWWKEVKEWNSKQRLERSEEKVEGKC